jgi:hypothetical protein
MTITKQFAAVGGFCNGRFLSAIQVAQQNGLDPKDCVLSSSLAMLVGMKLARTLTIVRPVEAAK